MVKDLSVKFDICDKELGQKTDKTYTKMVEETIKRFCLYDDLKNLRERFEPKFETMQDNMEVFR